MGESLLLHALSVHDRIIEPRDPPLVGRVWAYDKRRTTPEGFIGHCLTVLGALGIGDAAFSWRDDLIAFDAKHEGRTTTIVITLDDDSLASDYFYFLGIWMRPRAGDHPVRAARHRLLGEHARPHEAALAPAVDYAITVWPQPLAPKVCRKMLGARVLYGRSLQMGACTLVGHTEARGALKGRFVLMPDDEDRWREADIAHLLYSIRNMMALMGRACQLHEEMPGADAHALVAQAEALAERAARRTPPLGAEELLALERRVIGARAEIRQRLAQMDGIYALFAMIGKEIGSAPAKGLPDLFEQMRAPRAFVHGQAQARVRMLDHAGELAQAAHRACLLQRLGAHGR